MTELNTIDSTTDSAIATETAKPADSTKTLAQRLTEGRIPVEEGLRYAMLLADALRKMHDEGHAHGAVAPGNIAMTETGLELLASRLTPTATSYAAPEVLEGRAADARSDIFSFGAVLYEVLTGHAPYQGKDRSTPLPSGSPAVDRLVANCVALEPAARCQRLQKVMLELKLLSAAAARAGAPAAARRDAAAGDAIRVELAQLEARFNARLQAEEKKSAELLRVVGEIFTRVPEESAEMHSTVLQMESRVGTRLQDLDKKVAESQRVANEALYRELPQPGVDAAEVQALEGRVGGRLQDLDKKITEAQRVANEALYRELPQPGVNPADVQALEGRVGGRLQDLDKKITEAQRVANEALYREMPQPGVNAADVQALEGRVGGRFQEIEKKITEAHRVANDALYREMPQPGVNAAEVQALETRVAARMQQAIGEMQTIAADAVNALRSQLFTIGSQLAAAQERSERAEKSIEAASERLATRVQESINGVTERIAGLDLRIAALEQPRTDGEGARIEALENSLDALRKQNTELHDLVAEDMRGFEQNLKTQASAIESARTAMAQTDDLVERVVEALESLQSTVLDHSEERAMAVN